jgi:hypothetical protein
MNQPRTLHTVLVVLLVLGALAGAGLYWKAKQREDAVGRQARKIAQAHWMMGSSSVGSGLSWRVHLLPELGEDELYRKFHLDEPWDSPHNLPLVTEMPAAFRAIGSRAPVGWTTLKIFDLEGNSRPFLCETDDAHAAPWTRPDPSEPETGSKAIPLIGLDRGSG